MDKEQYIISHFPSAYNGDDGAVVGEFVYSMDGFFEDVHFKRSWMSMLQIGRKAMLVNISDAIAMNAKPLFALVTLALPKDISKEDIDLLAKGLGEAAQEFGCEIIGGDTLSAKKLSISITVISKSTNPLFRHGLKEGDLLAYTGSLGLVKRDLHRLFTGERIENTSRFYEPHLRLEFVAQAREFLAVGMDISDGLFCDANKLLDANNLDMELSCPIPNHVGESGEEYEMLIGFSPEYQKQIEAVAKMTQTPLSIFAKVVSKGERFVCVDHHFN